jgi:hypothetical protein
MHNMSGD